MVKSVTETPMTQMLTNVHELINKEWTSYERDTTFSYWIMVTPKIYWYALSPTLCLLGPFSLQWHLSQFRLYILIFSSTQAKSKYVWIQWKKATKTKKKSNNSRHQTHNRCEVDHLHLISRYRYLISSRDKVKPHYPNNGWRWWAQVMMIRRKSSVPPV